MGVRNLYILNAYKVSNFLKKFGTEFDVLRSKKGKGKGHPCTGTEALYRPYGP